MPDEHPAQVELTSILTCPACGHQAAEEMPQNACQWFHECPACKTLLRPKPGDCCVFCSYGDRSVPAGAKGGRLLRLTGLPPG